MRNERSALKVKTKFILSLSAAMLLVGCGEDATLTNEYYDSQTESAQATLNSTLNTGVDTSSYISHNQGTACLSCHAFGTPSDAPSYYISSRDNDEDDDDGEYPDDKFSSGGTVYTSLTGNTKEEYASGYKIRALLSTDLPITYSYDSEGGTANSYSNNSALSSSYTFTAQVINSSNEVVNSSVANSHNTTTHLNCNSCHTAGGSNGAPGRITSYNYYSAPAATAVTETNSSTPTTTVTTTTIGTAVSFASSVMPVLETKCKSCHGSSGNFSVTTAASTYTNLTTNSFVSTASADSSLLLTKAGGVSHGGGKILNTTSVEYQTLRDWITQGALNN